LHVHIDVDSKFHGKLVLGTERRDDDTDFVVVKKHDFKVGIAHWHVESEQYCSFILRRFPSYQEPWTIQRNSVGCWVEVVAI
jgi:hypothetical protein